MKKASKRTFFATFGAALIAAEVAGFLGSYFVWSKLNREQDFRLKCHQKFPMVLQAYYKFGEQIDSGNMRIREFDRMVWIKNGDFFK